MMYIASIYTFFFPIVENWRLISAAPDASLHVSAVSWPALAKYCCNNEQPGSNLSHNVNTQYFQVHQGMTTETLICMMYIVGFRRQWTYGFSLENLSDANLIKMYN